MFFGYISIRFLGVPHEKIRLSELDDNGHPILSWCERVSENDRKGFCRVCRKQFEISQHGLSTVKSH
jgi:hypothetical protein